MKRLLPLAFVLLFCLSVQAVIPQHSMKVFAVTSDDEIALSADLSLQIKPGTGKVWSSVEPLIGTSTQTTEKIAVQVAKNYSDKVDDYDYFFDINSTASLVDGPSAGAAMGLLVISMLQDKKLPKNVAITGTITVDGSVGAVGGVFKKAQKAASIGIDLFMIPKGEASQIVKLPQGVESINLTDYAKSEWGATVVEVSDIDTALKYAFSDIESIDVNTQTAFTPDFVPESIVFPDSLKPMQALTADYISRAEMRLDSARSALSGTLLTDPSVIDAMLSLLNESEKTLKQAKLLYDQNYLYSAANYSFLALVNASLVSDISDNPSLLDKDTTVWDLKLLSLRRKIEALKRDLNASIPIDYLEWHVAAKERLTWAEEKLGKLEKEASQIVITVGGTQQEESALDNLFDLEYAFAWVEAAEDFHSITVESTKRVSADSHFANLLDSYLASVENALSVLSDEEKEDIVRRIDSAKIARSNGWYASALFDAASALALANASIYVKNKDLDELDQYLNSKIASVVQAMQESGHSPVWAQLYLDHAVYYSKAVDFYKKQGENMKALEMAKNGISLAFLAENIFSVSSETYSYFKAIPDERYLPVVRQDTGLPLLGSVYLFAILALLLVLVAVLLFLLVRLSKKLREMMHYSLDERIKEIRKLQESLDKKWEQKKLSEQQYEQLNEEYHQKLGQLLDEKSEVSRMLVELDRDRALILAFEHALRQLKKQRKKGLLLRTDYQESFDYYHKRIESLKKGIAEKKAQLLLSEREPVAKQSPPKAPAKKEQPAKPAAVQTQKKTKKSPVPKPKKKKSAGKIASQ